MQIIPLDKLNNLQTKEEKISDLEFDYDAKKVDQTSIKEQPDLSQKSKELELKKTNITQDTPAPQNQPSNNQLTPEKIQQPKPQDAKIDNNRIQKNTTTTTKTKDDLDLKSLERTLFKKNDDLDLQNLKKTLTKNIEDKNNEKLSEGKKENSNKKSGSKNKDNITSKTDKYDNQSSESINAKFLLQKKIENNWSKPPSMRDYSKLKIKVKVKLNINQQVDEIYNFVFLNEIPPTNVQNVIKASIIRAIKLSEPFDMLSLEDYDNWQNNSFIFSYK